jgi:perosamine synthetase
MILQYEPYNMSEYSQKVADQIATGWIGPGEKTKEFEELVCKYTGAEDAVATTSGTAAILLSILACGLGPGDKVLVSDYSFIAAINCLRFLNIRPVLIDIKEDTLCMDPQQVLNNITRDTRAVIFINHNGYVGDDLAKIKDICASHDLFLIEDSACGFGQWHTQDTHAGLVGDIGCFSFSVPKLITTGQGGMVVTNSGLGDEVRTLLDQGSLDWRETGVHPYIGANFKFNDVLATLGIAQMNNLEDLLDRRAYINTVYKHYGLTLHETHSVKYTGPWMNILQVKNNNTGLWIRQGLESLGVETRVVYKPAHMSLGLPDEYFPVASEIWNKQIHLPSSLDLDETQLSIISNYILENLEGVGV